MAHRKEGDGPVRLGSRGEARIRGGVRAAARGDLAGDGKKLSKRPGIGNYSIFRYGLTLFGYFETDDLERTTESLSRSEVNRRWGEWMAPVMKMEVDPSTNFPYLLPLQWHMD